MSKSFKELYDGVFRVESSPYGFFVSYDVPGANTIYYLHTDGKLRPQAYGVGPGAYVPTREEAFLLLAKFRGNAMKNAAQTVKEQPVQKGIVIKYEKFTELQTERKFVKILSIQALGRESVPNCYVLEAPQAVWLAKKVDGGVGLDNYKSSFLPTSFFMREGETMSYTSFRHKMSYIAKAGHNLATIKEAHRKEAEERRKASVRKAPEWKGVRTIRL